MFNLSGSEMIFLLLIALVVLGPEKLPEAVRRFGKAYGEFKKLSTGFQSELRSALDEPMREMRDTADAMRKAATFEFDFGTDQVDGGSASASPPPSQSPRTAVSNVPADPPSSSSAASISDVERPAVAAGELRPTAESAPASTAAPLPAIASTTDGPADASTVDAPSPNGWSSVAASPSASASTIPAPAPAPTPAAAASATPAATAAPAGWSPVPASAPSRALDGAAEHATAPDADHDEVASG